MLMLSSVSFDTQKGNLPVIIYLPNLYNPQSTQPVAPIKRFVKTWVFLLEGAGAYSLDRYILPMLKRNKVQEARS